MPFHVPFHVAGVLFPGSSATQIPLCWPAISSRYGCKRFLLDGHQTVIENHNKLHYDPHELKQFMDIECEWPLFFTYLLLNNLCADNQVAAKEYRAKLEALLIEQNGQYLLPELYIVPADLIAAEKANPRSQDRIPNDFIQGLQGGIMLANE